MKLSWSIISIISRFTAVGIGIIQSIIIVKLLSVAEYGLIGLVGSIVAAVGVYQNLGISSGSTREIAASRDRSEAFKVFTGSILVRYAISIPLVLGLFLIAPYLGNTYYNRPEIILPIRLFAAVLFIQALQSVLNSVIQGLRQFKFLFTFQVAIAFISLATFIPLIIYFGFIGFFYAQLVFNIISTLVLLAYSYRLLSGYIDLPTRQELVDISKAVFSIGIYVYVIKIILTQWEKLGPLVLGRTVTDEMLGIFAFALLVSSKIKTISDAITDVTLPSMTDVFEKTNHLFKETFLKGNAKAFILMTCAAVLLVILKREAFILADFLFAFVGKSSITARYEDAFILMDPLILAFWAFGHINLLQSGLAVPSRKMFGALVSYIVMFVGTIGSFYIMNFDPLMNFSLAMGIGSLLGYFSFIGFVRKDLEFIPLSKIEVIYIFPVVISLLSYYAGFNHIIIAILFTAITVSFYVKYFKTKNNTV